MGESRAAVRTGAAARSTTRDRQLTSWKSAIPPVSDSTAQPCAAAAAAPAPCLDSHTRLSVLMSTETWLHGNNNTCSYWTTFEILVEASFHLPMRPQGDVTSRAANRNPALRSDGQSQRSVTPSHSTSPRVCAVCGSSNPRTPSYRFKLTCAWYLDPQRNPVVCFVNTKMESRYMQNRRGLK